MKGIEMKIVAIFTFLLIISCGRITTRYNSNVNSEKSVFSNLKQSSWSVYVEKNIVESAMGASKKKELSSKEISDMFVKKINESFKKVKATKGNKNLPRPLLGKISLNPENELKTFFSSQNTEYVILLSNILTAYNSTTDYNNSKSLIKVPLKKNKLSITIDIYKVKSRSDVISFRVIQEGSSSINSLLNSIINYIKKDGKITN